jgi:hypothetical protein
MKLGKEKKNCKDILTASEPSDTNMTWKIWRQVEVSWNIVKIILKNLCSCFCLENVGSSYSENILMNLSVVLVHTKCVAEKFLAAQPKVKEIWFSWVSQIYERNFKRPTFRAPWCSRNSADGHLSIRNATNYDESCLVQYITAQQKDPPVIVGAGGGGGGVEKAQIFEAWRSGEGPSPEYISDIFLGSITVCRV